MVVFKDIQYDADLMTLKNIPVSLGLKDEIRIENLRLPQQSNKINWTLC